MIFSNSEWRGACLAAVLTACSLGFPAMAGTLVPDIHVQSLASMRPSGDDVTVPEGTVGWPGARYPTSPPLHAVRSGTTQAYLYGGFLGIGPTGGLFDIVPMYRSFGLYSMQASVSVYERLSYDAANGLYGRINGTPVLAQDGRMYAVMTSLYGETAQEEDPYYSSAVGRGVIVRLDADGTHPERLDATHGALYSPNGSLVEGADGRLYGMDKGASGQGRIYAVDIVSGAVATIHAFALAPDGSRQVVNDLTAGQDGWLYGVTAYVRGLPLHPDTPTDPATATGTLFRIDPVQPGSFQVLHTFTLAQGEINTADNVTAEGMRYYPSGEPGVIGLVGDVTNRSIQAGSQTGLSSVLDAGDGYLYGNLSIGDCYVYHRLAPYSTGLTLISNNHPLCGYMGTMRTQSEYPFYDGPKPFGVIYRMARDGSGTLQVLHTFSDDDGATPRGPLALGKDGRIYGTTLSGGGNICREPNNSNARNDVGCGTVFRIDPAAIQVDGNGVVVTSGFASVHHFDGSDGRVPLGLRTGADGNLYGVTSLGGGYYTLSGQYVATNYGTVFQVRVGSDSSVSASASLVAERPEIQEGETATLTWITQSARDCRITSSSGAWDASVPTFGSHDFQPSPGTHRFTLTCFVEGESNSEQVSAMTTLSVGVPATAEDGNEVSYGNGGALSSLVVMALMVFALRRRRA